MKNTLKVYSIVLAISFLFIGITFYYYTIKPIAQKKEASKVIKGISLNYIGSAIIKDFNQIDIDKYQTAAGIYDLSTMAAHVTTQMKSTFSNVTTRSLPLVANWNTGIPEYENGLDPMYMINKLANGEHVVVSWKIDPYYADNIGLIYYETSIKKAKELGLPLVFILPSPESALYKDSVYFGMDKTQNPNVITSNGYIIQKLSPFGPDSLWNEIGEQWSSTSLMTQLQVWYPNPPLILFVSENEANKLSWNELGTSSRYIQEYSTDQDDEFKRTLVNAKWMEKYRQLHEGFKKGLIQKSWKENVKFVSRNQLAINMGKSVNWLDTATTTKVCANIWPMTSDALSVNFNLNGDKTDYTDNAPHITANNLLFMLDEAKQMNPNFTFELNLNANNKINNLNRYRGYAQFALWLLRPSIVRDTTAKTSKDEINPFFQEVIDSVELINYNDILADFWKNGKLVINGNSPLRKNIPNQYKDVPRWFLLDNDASQKVWAFTLIKGTRPNRQWLVYAQSPENNLSDITITIPNFRNIMVNVTQKGSFYIVDENMSNTKLISNQIKKTKYNKEELFISNSHSGEKFKFNFTESSMTKWASNGEFTINYLGFTNEKMFNGKKTFKIDITLENATYCNLQIPLEKRIPATGNLQLSVNYFISNKNEGQIAFGCSYSYYPSSLNGLVSSSKFSLPSSRWNFTSVDITEKAPIAKNWIFEKYGDKLGIFNTGTYIDRAEIYLSGKKHQRIVLYISDLVISGDIPNITDYNKLINEKWNESQNLLENYLLIWSDQLNLIDIELNNFNISQTFASVTFQKTLKKLNKLKQQLNLIKQRKYLVDGEKNQIKTDLSALKYAIHNIKYLNNKEIDNKKFIIYLPQTISDYLPLPTTILINGEVNSSINIRACKNEFLAKTYSIYALKNLNNITFKLSSFINHKTNRVMPSKIIDMKIVKSWYQSGSSSTSINYINKRVLTPELLLNNDNLIKIDTEKKDNYLLSNGKYINISENEDLSNINPMDSNNLQPINIKANTSKQIWLTIHIPSDAQPGVYTGTIDIYQNNEYQDKINLNITVLPFDLIESKIKQSMYYRGILNTKSNNTSLESNQKTLIQYESDLRNLKNHGILYPTMYQPYNEINLKSILDIRQKLDLPRDSIYVLGLKVGVDLSFQNENILKEKINNWKNILNEYNYKNIYIYGLDEARGDKLLSQRDAWKIVRDNGLKIFTACSSGVYESIGDLLDLAIYYGPLDKNEAAKFHTIGHKIFSYSNPQMGLEKPETYRKNYGLSLWKNNYDGAMDYAYQHPFGYAWNDFDDKTYKDHMMVYPTRNGYINTIQGEGYREGVNDLRYLATLQEAIRISQNKMLANQAELWLKDLSLDEDLDIIRQKMIDWILKLK